MLITYDGMYLLWSRSTPTRKQCKHIYCTSLFVTTFFYTKLYFYVQPQHFLLVTWIYSCTKDILMQKYKMLVLVIIQLLSDLDLDLFFLIPLVSSTGFARESTMSQFKLNYAHFMEKKQNKQYKTRCSPKNRKHWSRCSFQCYFWDGIFILKTETFLNRTNQNSTICQVATNIQVINCLPLLSFT